MGLNGEDTKSLWHSPRTPGKPVFKERNEWSSYREEGTEASQHLASRDGEKSWSGLTPRACSTCSRGPAWAPEGTPVTLQLVPHFDLSGILFLRPNNPNWHLPSPFPLSHIQFNTSYSSVIQTLKIEELTYLYRYLFYFWWNILCFYPRA